jgi:Fe-Mn family superoxide dismutase
VINNGGGHVNHSMFWLIMGPGAGGKPSGPLADAINHTFTDFATFQTKMKEACVGRFGSGWGWLVLADGKLQIVSSANQDNPYTDGQVPIMGIDVWEHAYYLKYQNKRADYIDAWWNVVNWSAVAQRYTDAKAGKPLRNRNTAPQISRLDPFAAIAIVRGPAIGEIWGSLVFTALPGGWSGNCRR